MLVDGLKLSGNNGMLPQMGKKQRISKIFSTWQAV